MKITKQQLTTLFVAATLGTTALVMPSNYGHRAQVELAAKGGTFSPVLPLTEFKQSPLSPYLFVRDSNLSKLIPEDNYGVNRLTDEIKAARTDLQTARGARVLELHQQAFRAYATLAYYLEDKAQDSKELEQLRLVRRQLVSHAEAAARLSQGAERDEAQYHAVMTTFIVSEQNMKDIKHLASTVKSQRYKLRYEMLIMLCDLGKAQGAERMKLLQLASSKAKAFSPSARAGIHAVLAANAAGVGSGRPALREYRGYLATAMALGSRETAPGGTKQGQGENLIGFGVHVWSQAEKKLTGTVDWSKPPFPLKGLSDTANAKALIERSALGQWQHGDHAKAVKIYRVLAQNEADMALKQRLKLRSLDLLANSKMDSAQYEKELKLYLSAEEIPEVAKKAGDLYRLLAQNALTKAEHDKSAVTASVNLAKRYLSQVTDPQTSEGTKALLAKVLLKYERFNEAKSLYIELADAANDGKKTQYRSLAIRAATPLAGWDETAPWQKLKLTTDKSHADERRELLHLYTQLEAEKAQELWFVAAHRGLLHISLGEGEQAFQLWHERLEKNPRGQHAERAGGYMLTFYTQTKAWENGEKLARLLLTKKMVARHTDRVLQPKDFLALTLLEGGKEALQAQNFPVSVAKLKEFVSNHQGANRYDEGFYLLGHAYYGSRAYDAAVKNMIAFTQNYRQSKYYREALLNGGAWAQTMAYEESMIYFYQTFADGFIRDKEAARVRRDLERLYLGLQQYAKAVHVLEQERDVAQRSEGTAITAKIMMIEYRYGSEERANSYADALIKANATAHFEDAYLIKGRSAFKKGDLRTLKQYAARLSSNQAPEALAEIRFYTAEIATKDVIQDSFNLELRDPKSTLSARYDAYKNARAAYQAVCSGGANQTCPDAMVKLSQLSLSFMSSIDDIAIQNTLSQEEVANFNQYKDQIMADAADSAEKADSTALAAVKEGATDPDATMAVLWHNTSDWSFDRVTGDSGNGYVQIHENAK